MKSQISRLETWILRKFYDDKADGKMNRKSYLTKYWENLVKVIFLDIVTKQSLNIVVKISEIKRIRFH